VSNSCGHQRSRQAGPEPLSVALRDAMLVACPGNKLTYGASRGLSCLSDVALAKSGAMSKGAQPARRAGGRISRRYSTDESRPRRDIGSRMPTCFRGRTLDDEHPKTMKRISNCSLRVGWRRQAHGGTTHHSPLTRALLPAGMRALLVTTILCGSVPTLLQGRADAWPFVIPRWQLVPQSYDFWEAARRVPGFSVRRLSHLGHRLDVAGPWSAGPRWSYWEWPVDQAPEYLGYAPVPTTGMDSLRHWGCVAPGPYDAVLTPRTAVADTAVSLIKYERGDWGRESYAGSFSGLLVDGVRLDAVLWGDGWGGDRVGGGAYWDVQHYEGRLVGSSGWVALRRLTEGGGVLAPLNEERPDDRRRGSRSDWSAGVRLPRGLTLEGSWGKDEENWRTDSTTSGWVERGTAGLRHEADWRAIRVQTHLRWVHELVGGQVGFRFRQLQCRSVAPKALGPEGAAEGGREARGEERAGWGFSMVPPGVRGWKVLLGIGGCSSLRGARERAVHFPEERWRGAGLGLGRDRPVRWMLWGRVGRAWGRAQRCELQELPWWEYAPERAEDDVAAAGIVASAEGSWFWVSGWGELISRKPVDPEYAAEGGSGDGGTRRCWHGLADGGVRIPVGNEVSMGVGGSLRGESIEERDGAGDRGYVVGAVRGLLEVGRARIYVCVEQPTGSSWEEVPGYPLRAPMVYAGVEWTFTK
jgi:hypothetical protein